MSELEWANFFGHVLWIGSLVSPILVGAATLWMIRRSTAEQAQAVIIGILTSIGLGAAGTFAHGERVIGSLMGSGDIPYYLVATAWHRSWYPMGIGLIVGVALCVVFLRHQSSAA